MATTPAETTQTTAARDANRRIRRSGNVAGWAFAGPSVLIVLGLSFIPMIWAGWLSLTNSNLVTGGHFIGLANYAALHKDAQLRQAFTNTLLLAVMYLPIGLLAGLGVAMLLNRKIKLIGFYRTAFLVPFVASTAAEGLLFSFIFDPNFGIVNSLLQAVGLPRQGFLQDPSEALVVLAIVYFWTQFGFNIVIYLAALQDIPEEVLEAASIDGARKWSKFWNIVVPTVRPVTIFLLIWSLIDVFQFFDLVYTTTKGGPLNSTLTLVYYIWELAFQFFTAGYGAAVAYVLFFTTLIVIIAALLFGRRRRIAL
ncbi:MAG TPA: sugar ABC transporter permease [Streptosporangiaceae bacterium]|jgi:multiple sugar transport system permease protein